MKSESAFWLLVVLFLALLAGCSSARRGARDASAEVSAGPAGVQVEQSGAAAVPAKATRTASHVATWIPAGVEVTAWLDGRVTWKTSKPVPFTQHATAETATGPQSFTPPEPPPPPSPGEIADGRARWLGWIGLFVGIALVFVGFKGWPMVGTGGAGVAGASVAVLALSAVPRFVWAIGGGGLTFAALGVVLWHLWLKKRQSGQK